MAEYVAGSVVAGHRIESEIARGGMGVVYRATHLGLGRTVALKLIAPELARDPVFRERFAGEARIAASLEHSHVVPVYEAGEDGDVLYLAMRFIDGIDLRTLVQRDGLLTPVRAVRLLRQIGEALDAAHARGLVHRDVKPANILVGAGDHAYLTDFGLTKLAASTGMTKTGMVVGTLDYIAPEQLQGKPVDARTDVYALGCVLFQVLAGRPPFDRDNDTAKMFAHINDPPPSLQGERPDVPAALDDVIRRALTKDPAGRFPSAGDLGEAAMAAIEGRSPGAPERSVAIGAAAPVATVAADPEFSTVPLEGPAEPPPLPPPAMPPPAMPPPAMPPPAMPPAMPVAAAVPLAMQRDDRDRDRGAPWAIAVVATVGLLVAGALGAIFLLGGDDEKPQRAATKGAAPAKTQLVHFQMPTAPGPDPFTKPVDVRGKDKVRVGSGPYGGTGSDLVCDRELLISSLRARVDRLREWARVRSLRPRMSVVAKYIRSLRPVTLTRDTRVTNHSFASGHAVAFQSILQAGTAVLVDRRGKIVARCRCGNPLLEPVFIPEAQCFGCPQDYDPPEPCSDIADCYRRYPHPPTVVISRPRPKPTVVPTQPPVEETPEAPDTPATAGFDSPVGHQGDSFTLRFSGFRPNIPITINLIRPDGVPEKYFSSTGPDGSGSYTFAPTGGADVLGQYDISVSDPDTGEHAETTATLLE